MKQIEFSSVGIPEEVVQYADTDMPSGPRSDEVLVKVLAFPINPADLLTLQGIYPRLDASTKALGNEAVGEILATGGDVEELEPGDRVILLSLNNWREYRLVKAHEVVEVSPHGDLIQQSGLKVNPATASMLLRDFRKAPDRRLDRPECRKLQRWAGRYSTGPSFGYQDDQCRSTVRRRR